MHLDTNGIAAIVRHIIQEDCTVNNHGEQLPVKSWQFFKKNSFCLGRDLFKIFEEKKTMNNAIDLVFSITLK